MSTTTAKRGAGTKFLALLASLTMMIAGLVGVALSAPASADQPENPGGNESCEDYGARPAAGFTYTIAQDTQTADWSAGEPVDFVLVKGSTDSKQVDVAGAESGTVDNSGLSTPNEENSQTAGISNLRGCVTDETPEYYCPKDSDFPETKLDGPYDEATDKDTCYKKDDPTKIWICHWVPGEGGKYLVLNIDESAWDGEGHSGHEMDKKINWTGEGEPTEADCDTTDRQTVYWCDGDQVKSGNQTRKNGGAWTPVYNANESTSEPTCGSTPPPPVDPPANDPQPEPAPVVAAAVVEAPAPAPAVVAAPAPATVAVPAAATLPAAVPAGEGSSNGLPMWALAMVAMGMIGAAFAGKQLLGARK